MKSPFPDGVMFSERDGESIDAKPEHPEEIALVAQADSTTRRRQFALGRACARDALRQLGAPGDAVIGRGEGRIPRWPQGFVGSITHSHHHAAAAVARAHDYLGLGIDLERIRAPSPGLLRRILRPAERDALAALDGPPLATAFTALFSTKEALYKALNPLTGVYLGFQDAEVEFPATTDWSGTSGHCLWYLLKHSGLRFGAGFSARGAWSSDGTWIVTGVWLPND